MAKIKIGQMIRQGDVGLVRIRMSRKNIGKPIPRKGGRIVLAEGETTGHSHSLDAEKVTAYAGGAFGGKMVIVVDAESTPLLHEEHRAIELVRGAFDVVSQFEYEPDDIRRVMD